MLLFAQAQGGGGGGFLSFLPIVAIIALMYFLLIRPQNKRRREADEMRAQLGVGDDIETVGGMRGTVTAIDDTTVTIEPSPGVHLVFAKGAIGKVLRSEPVADEAADEEKND